MPDILKRSVLRVMSETIQGRLRLRTMAPFVVFALALNVGTSFTQQVPPPKPKAKQSSGVTQSRRSILVTSDMNVVLTIDGGAQRRLKEGVPVSFPIGLGDHLLHAVFTLPTENGTVSWYRDKTVTIEAGDVQTIVQFTMQEEMLAASQQQAQVEADAAAKVAADRERLSSLTGKWKYVEESSDDLGHACYVIQSRTEIISIQNISDDGSYASGTATEYYSSKPKYADVNGRCTERFQRDGNCEQTGSVTVSCANEDDCVLKLVFSPPEGGGNCDHRLWSPGPQKWRMEGRSPQSFTRCVFSCDDVFKKQ